MKYFKTILVLLLLIGLPIGSWYFLNSGLEWRKDKISDLKTKDRFMDAYSFTNQDKTRLYEIMAHRTSVVKLKGTLSNLDSSLIDQFKNAYTFQFVSFDKTMTKSQGWSSKSVVHYYKPESSDAKFNRIKDADYALVDTSGFVRQYYEGSSKQVLNILVEDVAVILPRKKSKDIGIRETKSTED